MDEFKAKQAKLIKEFCDGLSDAIDAINAETDRPYPMVAMFLAVPRTGDADSVNLHVRTSSNVVIDLTKEGRVESVIAFPMLCSIAQAFAKDSVDSVLAMAKAEGETIDDPQELHRELTEVMLEGALKFHKETNGIITADISPDDMLQ